MHSSNTSKKAHSLKSGRPDCDRDVARFYDQHVRMHLIELHNKRMRQMDVDAEMQRAQAIIDLCNAAAAAETTGPTSVDKARELLAAF
ncbi:hypothetical protein [Phyllobacterium sp. K27]